MHGFTVNEVGIYPNPVSENLNLEIYSKRANGNFEIFDLNGRKLIQNHNFQLVEGLNKINFDVSNLKGGIYFLKTEVNESQRIDKIVVKH